MFDRDDQAICQVLERGRFVPSAQLVELQAESSGQGKSLADLAIEHGLVSPSVLLAAVADFLGCRFLADLPTHLSAETVALLPVHHARAYGVVPLQVVRDVIEVVAVDPFDGPRIIEDLSFALSRSVRLVVADPSKIAGLIRHHYGEDEGSLDELLRDLGSDESSTSGVVDPSIDDLESMAEQAPVIRLVNLILGRAIRERASDIHFEPFEDEFKVRYRRDGTLVEMAPPPKKFALPITSRLKVLANLNIAERRVPQDGRLKLNLAGRAVDLRVSTLPTQFGESVVMRVLDQSAVQLSITDLGMSDHLVAAVQEIVRRPNGIFVVTGPTGSGKTTTLYSALRLINTPDLKLLTAEDPVEYEIDGVVQVGICPPVGLTFSAALRSFLRQDPDVIMVGEIRDLETAQIAVQASLTGHLVLSTLHTNDASGAVTRLVDMGIEPFLIASSLEGVLAQRLVRRVCPSCRVQRAASALDLAQLGISRERVGQTQLYQPVGCPDCNASGYRGRTGIYEWLRMSEPVRELVMSREPSLQIRRKAMELGMETLRESGIKAVLSGATTVQEVVKCT